MELMFENQEEDKEYLARRARRKERWLQEQRRRRRRQRMIRRLLVLGAGILLLVFLILSVRALVEKFSKADTNREQEQTAELELPEETVTDETEEELAAEEEAEAEPEAVPVYAFTEAADMVGIYSEEVVSTHAVFINESTDEIVAAKGAYERISPASMTKVLTVLVAAEQIGEEQLEDTFVMTREITDYAYVNDCSAVNFMDGEKVTVKDLFYGTILPSGADAAVGLATYAAGSHEAFVDLMNGKLEELGLSDTAHFTNCVGLYDVNHYCTLYDMAVIMKAAVKNEICREVLAAKKYTTTATVEHPEGIPISNWFLRRIEDKDTGGEMLCAKTGYVV